MVKIARSWLIPLTKGKPKKQSDMKDNHARFVRLPTRRANSVSILREMSSAFTECVSAPLQKINETLSWIV